MNEDAESTVLADQAGIQSEDQNAIHSVVKEESTKKPRNCWKCFLKLILKLMICIKRVLGEVGYSWGGKTMSSL